MAKTRSPSFLAASIFALVVSYYFHVFRSLAVINSSSTLSPTFLIIICHQDSSYLSGSSSLVSVGHLCSLLLIRRSSYMASRSHFSLSMIKCCLQQQFSSSSSSSSFSQYIPYGANANENNQLLKARLKLAEAAQQYVGQLKKKKVELIVRGDFN